MMIRIGTVVLVLFGAAPAASLHEVTYLGTVLAIEATRVQVRAVDEMTKKEETLWFVTDKDTKVKRGDTLVTYADAGIMKGERIVVIVDHDAPTKMLAMELRLAEMDVAMALMKTGAGAATRGQMPGMPGMDMGTGSSAWKFMEDGVVTGLFNHQGGPRGGNEFVAPNWWMGMLTREHDRQQFGLNAMFSLDPATIGKGGYREIFQIGEALDGKPLIDRQHPHDLFMQLAGSWRLPMGDKMTFILSGGPVGEPTLGPVAFMHRASAAGLPLAPLGHHTFDSTHVSFGVVAAAVERGRWTFEGSAFNGREPDDNRWDFDFGAMDSVAGRVWLRPTAEWDIQVSTGHLRSPEALEPGDVQRTTASASWFRKRDNGFKAVTVGYGVNALHGERRHGVFGEFTIEEAANSVFGRADVQQVETSLLITGAVADAAHTGLAPATVAAVTLGAGRRLFTSRGFEGALNAEVTLYGVPGPLKATHGAHPVSFQLFFRLRLPTGSMGRMFNMRMSQGDKMDMDHGGHVMR